MVSALMSSSSGDESGCNTLAKQAFYPPIYSAVATMAIGCTLLVVKMVVESCCKEKKVVKTKKEAESPEGAEVDKMIRCAAKGTQLEGNYHLLHQETGGVRMLVGAAFAVLETPQERHLLSMYIFQQELDIHKSRGKALRCLRSKCWSQKETFDLIDHVAEPNCLKKAKHKV